MEPPIDGWAAAARYYDWTYDTPYTYENPAIITPKEIDPARYPECECRDEDYGYDEGYLFSYTPSHTCSNCSYPFESLKKHYAWHYRHDDITFLPYVQTSNGEEQKVPITDNFLSEWLTYTEQKKIPCNIVETHDGKKTIYTLNNERGVSFLTSIGKVEKVNEKLLKTVIDVTREGIDSILKSADAAILSKTIPGLPLDVCQMISECKGKSMLLKPTDPFNEKVSVLLHLLLAPTKVLAMGIYNNDLSMVKLALKYGAIPNRAIHLVGKRTDVNVAKMVFKSCHVGAKGYLIYLFIKNGRHDLLEWVSKKYPKLLPDITYYHIEDYAFIDDKELHYDYDRYLELEPLLVYPHRYKVDKSCEKYDPKKIADNGVNFYYYSTPYIISVGVLMEFIQSGERLY